MSAVLDDPAPMNAPNCSRCGRLLSNGEQVAVERGPDGVRQYRHRDTCPNAQEARAPEADPATLVPPQDELDEEDEALLETWAAHGETLRATFAELLEQMTRGRQRHRTILVERLGLLGGQPRTLAEIGIDFGLTRERIRQLEGAGLMSVAVIAKRLSGRDPGGQAEDLFRQLLTSPQPPLALLHAAEAAFPAAWTRTAVRALLAMIAMPSEARQGLSEQVLHEAEARNERLVRRYKSEKAALRASWHVARLLAGVEWPENAERASFLTAPQTRPVIAGQASPAHQARARGGSFTSRKLGRTIGYDSRLELVLLSWLDADRHVVRYTEQPLQLAYTDHEQHRRMYFPDLLVQFADGRIVLMEVKPLAYMPHAENQAKFAAARRLAAERGWGFLVTDGYHNYRLLQEHVPPPQSVAALEALVTRGAGAGWAEVRLIRHRYGLSTLDLASAIVQRGWQLTLTPYRLRPG